MVAGGGWLLPLNSNSYEIMSIYSGKDPGMDDLANEYMPTEISLILFKVH